MEIKKLDLTKKEFTANNNKYIILDAIPLGRYVDYLRESPKLAYGASFQEIFKQINRAYELLNTGKKYADVGIILHNIMNGIKNVEEPTRHDAALRICTMFIVREGEDISTIDENLIQSKIDDWSKEGYEINGFFHLALLSIEGFLKTFEEFTLNKK